ncbi:B12-binding domain-containing radical SAM protein [Candidatus Leptofilum sp.]|uniref:B12-binding domain-containing radical SAM protein n=1 Tax=Candidatus Leptofilum sp. TaxID=3241576 RepID=UPI003B59F367
MSDILFGQSYYLKFDPKLWQAMQPYPPLGTLIAASVAREQGYSVALFDAMLADSPVEWQVALQQHQPRFAVIYEDSFNYLSKMCLLAMREAAFAMIEMAKAAGCTVILCGSDATDHATSYLQKGANFVLLGEGEETMVELLAVLDGRSTTPFSQITGLAYGENSRIQQNPRRPVLTQIDDLPRPAWDLVDVEKYRQLWLARHGYYSMNMVTTRGCPYHCNWCAKPIWGQRYNARSPQAVAAEMRWLQETHQPDHIWFADDIMGLKPGWWPEFAAEVQARGVHLPFKCLSRADLIVRQPDNVQALKQANCDIIWLGAESGSQRILDAMEKGTTVEQIREATQKLQAAGVKVGFFLQFGYVGETWQDIQKTLQLVRDCLPDDIGISVSYPLPGTRFHERVATQLGTQKNWVDSADLAMMYQGTYTTQFYRQLHTAVHLEFRARRSWLKLRSLLTQPSQWRGSHLYEMAAIAYRWLRLPLARWRLRRLRKVSQSDATLLPHMPLAQSAQPSPQPEENS